MIIAIDHLVLTVRDVDTTLRFYTDVLGMTAKVFQPATGGQPRHALYFGKQKINLHPETGPYQPHAKTPVSGSGDICFLTDWSIQTWETHLQGRGVEIEEGPVMRSGAVGAITSIYIRDPDGNLIEIACAEPQ